MIKVGKKVAWTYQAGGVEFSQEGKMIAVVSANDSANDALAAFDPSASPRQKKFFDTSSNDRYLIAVKNENGIMVYYTPTVGVVDKQNPKAVKEWEKEQAKATVSEDAQGDNAPAKTETMQQVQEGVKKGRKPSLNAEFTMGNTTVYRIFATNAAGNFMGYRLFGGNYKLKFLVSAAGQDWTYHSGVRKAYSGYTHATVKGDKVTELLSIPECNKFASSIESQIKKMGFDTVTVDNLLTDLLAKAGKSNVRRTITAEFSNSKY